MTKQVDYYICLISPYTYMGDARLNEIAEKFNVDVNYKPVNLGQIFPETGGLPLGKRAPARQAYRMQELERWRDFLGLPLNTAPAHFPAAEWPAAGMVIAAKQQGMNCGDLVNGFLSAVWAEERDISDKDTMIAIANERGFDGNSLFEAAEAPSIRDIWEANSSEALAAGVFGAPTYVFDGQLYWGQDRLDFLERGLAAS